MFTGPTKFVLSTWSRGLCLRDIVLQGWRCTAFTMISGWFPTLDLNSQPLVLKSATNTPQLHRYLYINADQCVLWEGIKYLKALLYNLCKWRLIRAFTESIIAQRAAKLRLSTFSKMLASSCTELRSLGYYEYFIKEQFFHQSIF